MKVLKPGNVNKFISTRAICETCKAELSIELKDLFIFSDWEWSWFICGSCGKMSSIDTYKNDIEPRLLPTQKEFERDKKMAAIVAEVIKKLK